jgi:predicted RNA-binding protein Jag
MCAYERKIIHNALSKFKDIKTRSKDEEPNRRIIIYPVSEAE